VQKECIGREWIELATLRLNAQWKLKESTGTLPMNLLSPDGKKTMAVPGFKGADLSRSMKRGCRFSKVCIKLAILSL
jgi:hypothetical protein